MIPRKTPLKRSSKPLKRTAVKKVRSKPRRGRVKGKKMGKLRQKAYDRDNGCCVACGRSVDPEAPVEADNSCHLAHKRGKRNFGDHIDNVEVNCGGCHREFHERGPSREKVCPPKPKG